MQDLHFLNFFIFLNWSQIVEWKMFPIHPNAKFDIVMAVRQMATIIFQNQRL